MELIVTAALDAICLLCDRQQEKMQDTMRNKVSVYYGTDFCVIIFIGF